MCYDPARVDILIDYRPALRQRTGVGQYLHGLAAALASKLDPADTLTLFSSSWKDRLPRAAIRNTGQIDRRLPVRVLNLLWHRLEWPPVEWLAGQADVVHSFHPLLIPVRSAARLVTIHDLYFLDRPEDTTAEIRRDYPVLAQSHARRADGVVVNSRYTGSQVADRFGISADRITVCYPGKPPWPPRGDPGPGGPILFLGTVQPRKNVPRLIEAYVALLERRPETADLVIAGAMPTSADEIVSRVRMNSRVKFVGYISETERQRLLAAASVLVIPSLEEGFGIPALEAMTIGLPVVASNRGALPEVIGDAGILVNPEDVRGLAEALERVLTDGQLRQSLSARGVEQAGRFNWESSAEALYQGYRAAVVRRRQSAS